MKIKDIFESLDYYLSILYNLSGKDKNSLLTFLFHGIFYNAEEANSGTCDPQQAITLEYFDNFISFYKNKNYQFIGPNDLYNGLESKGKYVLLTFDDGYYNNLRVLPVLKKHKVPAVFFISTNHIENQKSFWWDVVYREEFKRGKSKKDIAAIQGSLKHRKTFEIENLIKNRYGKNSFSPVSQSDRPMTTAELKEFAKEELIFIGNHTCNHEILTNLSNDELSKELKFSQEYFERHLGIKPEIFAYPNGNFSLSQNKIIKEYGFKVAITTQKGRNRIPLNEKKLLYVKRFTPNFNQNNKHFNFFRSYVIFFRKFYMLIKTLKAKTSNKKNQFNQSYY